MSSSLKPQLHKIQDWWLAYNTIRPHNPAGYLTLDEYEQVNQNLYFTAVEA